MRLWTLLLCLSLLVVACRNQSGTVPSPTARTETPGATVTPSEGAGGDEGGASTDEDAPATSEDLRAARFAVVFHMTQIEGMSFPLMDEWTRDSVSEDGESRTYTFRSGEWTMSLASPPEDEPDVLYYVTITGPDDLTYRAQMDHDGNLAPAQ